MNRRQFLKVAAATAVVVPTAAVGYGFAESESLRVERVSLPLSNLPRSFDGLRVAFLTDIHHGPYTELEFVTQIVRTTLTLQPDLILLGGDYCLRERKYIAPCFDVLRMLSAPLGVFGVLGNHDYWHGGEEAKAGMRRAGIDELTDRGVWLTRGSNRLRLGGVDDLWCGQPDVTAAVGDATREDAVLLLSHNPDLAETLSDKRVGLMLSGHTHGGQVIVPGMTNPFIPSRYGDKYSHGRVEAPAITVYVSRGLGLTGLPVRYNCPPELTLITLTAPNT
jgi:predicted MPP superfamily phosphohydrolase